jgi:hypothetical protein
MRLTKFIGLAGGTLAVLLTATAYADAKPRKRVVVASYGIVAPPLTIKQRSFLDPGPMVPVGSLSNYVTANTIFNRTPDQVFARSKFGNEALPAPLEVPGRPQPIVEFYTPSYNGYYGY